jgi:hypothetical protein
MAVAEGFETSNLSSSDDQIAAEVRILINRDHRIYL